MFINFSPVSDAECKDHQSVILYPAYKPIITYPVSPLSFSLPDKLFTLYSGVGTVDKIFAYPCLYHLHCIAVKLPEFLFKSGCDLN